MPGAHSCKENEFGTRRIRGRIQSRNQQACGEDQAGTERVKTVGVILKGAPMIVEVEFYPIYSTCPHHPTEDGLVIYYYCAHDNGAAKCMPETCPLLEGEGGETNEDTE